MRGITFDAVCHHLPSGGWLRGRWQGARARVTFAVTRVAGPSVPRRTTRVITATVAVDPALTRRPWTYTVRLTERWLEEQRAAHAGDVGAEVVDPTHALVWEIGADDSAVLLDYLTEW